MSKRTAASDKAIRVAWERERQLVSNGQGTRDWTPEQQTAILDPEQGRALDDNGKPFQGHHMKSVAKYPDCQGIPDNIQFLTREEHWAAHKESWLIPTNWYYDPASRQFLDFDEHEIIPCGAIDLSNPIVRIENCDMDAVVDEAKQVEEKTSSSTDPPIKNTHQPTKPGSPVHTPVLSPAAKHMPKDNGIKDIVFSVGKVAKRLWNNHKDKIIGIALVAGAWAWESHKASNSHFEDGSNPFSDNSVIPSPSADNYGFSPVVDDNYSYSSNIPDCDVEPDLLTEKRKSPVEHTVPGHGQYYWKGGERVWKEKEAYQRGKPKNDE